jgi:hypothetical protein
MHAPDHALIRESSAVLERSPVVAAGECPVLAVSTHYPAWACSHAAAF